MFPSYYVYWESVNFRVIKRCLLLLLLSFSFNADNDSNKDKNQIIPIALFGNDKHIILE